MSKKFSQFWKSELNIVTDAEVIFDGTEYIAMWKENGIDYSEVFPTAMAASEKIAQLNHEKIDYFREKFQKSESALTEKEIKALQGVIARLIAQKKPASAIIKYLQTWNDKLSEYYQAKRAFETENKLMQTGSVLVSSAELGLDKFKCLLSPDACKTCRIKTDNGNKIFTEHELARPGYGNRPPFHPQCYCALVPVIE